MPYARKPAPCSAEKLRSLFTYDQESGDFRRRRGHGSKGGKAAGTINRAGHVVIMLLGQFHYAHRLAWLYVTGEWPQDEIDHKNRQRADNRFSNLREASRAQNQANKLARSKSGFKGVYLRDGKFESQIRVAGKCRWLGAFQTVEEASAVYMAAATKAFGEFARG